MSSPGQSRSSHVCADMTDVLVPDTARHAAFPPSSFAVPTSTELPLRPRLLRKSAHPKSCATNTTSYTPRSTNGSTLASTFSVALPPTSKQKSPRISSQNSTRMASWRNRRPFNLTAKHTTPSWPIALSRESAHCVRMRMQEEINATSVAICSILWS
jgi:hypothetical protein